MTARPRPVRRLPDALVNKIAAGEVVERPASVVKELVENSLDAASTLVSIAVRGAGRQLISVVDDGHGMTAEDCQLALERHATSKLAAEADLTAIDTLGFRGEALPAIFAVSRLRLASRVPAAAAGFLILGEGGVVHQAGEAELPDGTAVEARDLFFNTPARAKFLKSPPTEQAAILRVVTQLALAHPGVHLRLTANGRLALNAPRAAGLRDRVGSLYGFGLAARLVEVAAERGAATMTGPGGAPVALADPPGRHPPDRQRPRRPGHAPHPGADRGVSPAVAARPVPAGGPGVDDRSRRAGRQRPPDQELGALPPAPRVPRPGPRRGRAGAATPRRGAGAPGRRGPACPTWRSRRPRWADR